MLAIVVLLLAYISSTIAIPKNKGFVPTHTENKLHPKDRKPGQPINECFVKWDYWYDSFVVQGLRFNKTLLGPSGEGLHKELKKRCQHVIAWRFKRYSYPGLRIGDLTFEWWASISSGLGRPSTDDSVGWR